MKYAIFLCDESQIMAMPWAQAGYHCICVDLEAKEPRHPNIETVKMNIKAWTPTGIHPEQLAFICAFVPCTDLATSGARWFADKGLEAANEATQVVIAAKRWCEFYGSFGVPWFIENPVSVLSSYWRKSDFSFNPCDYGDPYTKKTCLWTGGGFTLPPKTPVEPTQGSKMHLLPPSDDRASLRSKTPEGFASAVFMHLSATFSTG